MTTAMEHQLTAFGARTEAAGQLLSTTVPVDAGLLMTLNSRTHCRTPMQRVDHDELPVRQPVYVDGDTVVSLRPGSVPDSIVTYRCACGFTIDDPGTAMAVTGQALAS
ncbi:hypothetical protein [Arthrobacter sp. NicSoilC5]|uniref:hypothetical protein n=1 Tax=Arthrobacter sp. NicSoilC5 TaxID=2831000 RepID=UPI001CC6AFB9|nr:hypothetical protein [Arthrobacter sp. NicSoilC5]BCW81185.1 hypothetical protein NicSoilC5_32040 [Arthrobacter sp. NicSoilC5]